MLYGYVREGYPVSESIQLKEIFKTDCDEVVIENGGTTTYEKLTRLMKRMSTGDKIVIYNLQVFGTGLKKLKLFLLYLQQHDLHLQSMKDNIDTEVVHNFFEICQILLSTDEKNASYLIRKSLSKARKMGKKIGRPKIDPNVVKKIQYLYIHEAMSLRGIADKCEVSLGTVYKYVSMVKQTDSSVE